MLTKLRVIAPIVAVLVALGAACGTSDSGPSSSGSGPAAGPSKRCVPTGSVAHRDLRYASTPGVAASVQSLDLYIPARPSGCPPVPVVAYVHGGGFRIGDKANHLTDKVNLFTNAGWAFASLNYRLVGNPGSGATNGVYPAAEQDVAAGIGYLARDASRYGLDAHRVMLLGHSAGAHLVALVSTDGSFLEAAGVSLHDVVCTAPLDTTYDIPAHMTGGGMDAAMYRAAFGDDPGVWAQGSPSRNVAAGKGIPAFHIVTRGSRARVAEAQAFGTTLRNAGVDVDVQVAAGLSHEQVNDAVGRAGESLVTPALMSFYRGCVK